VIEDHRHDTVCVHRGLGVVVELQVRSVGTQGVDVEGAVLHAVPEIVLVAEPGGEMAGVRDLARVLMGECELALDSAGEP